MQNLDYLAATYGQQICEAERGVVVDVAKIEDSATTALSILHEQGLYAMFLWLYEDRDERHRIGSKLSAMLCDPSLGLLAPDAQDHGGRRFFSPQHAAPALNAVRDGLTRDLTRALFLKDLIARALVYARHRAKAEPRRREAK